MLIVEFHFGGLERLGKQIDQCYEMRVLYTMLTLTLTIGYAM
jgi:hypothetical protein